MKIRTGFVSNSSSTSWAVAYRPDSLKFCEHCQRGDQIPLEMVRAVEEPTAGDSNANLIHFPDANSWIAHFTKQIEEWKKIVAKLIDRPAGDVYYEQYLLDSCTVEELEEMKCFQPKVWEEISFLEKRINNAERSIDKLKKMMLQGYEVCSFTLRYGEPANRKLEHMVKNGVVVLLKDIG